MANSVGGDQLRALHGTIVTFNDMVDAVASAFDAQAAADAAPPPETEQARGTTHKR
jgi:hypothetical protein